MIALDLCCCAGGMAVGLHRAGFEVVGVDVVPQPRYPFPFVQMDALEALRVLLRGGKVGGLRLRDFALVHGSPPCQGHSVMSKAHNGRPQDHPDLIPWMRMLMQETGLPYVIENVPGAPLEDPVQLCGTMFPGLRVKRHRLFESNVALRAPGRCPAKHPRHHTRDRRKPHFGKTDEWRDFVQVTGGGNSSKAAAADALGIDWPMTKQELNESIPPAYGEWIGRQIAAVLGA